MSEVEATAPIKSWGPILSGYPLLFSEDFLAEVAGWDWQPLIDDSQAAATLHIQLVSRVTTQELNYSHGIEINALTSVYNLFEQTRQISEKYLRAVHFEKTAWHVLNNHVRQFTAKWHKKSKNGALDALDETDQFRRELRHVQSILRSFDSFLLFLRDGIEHPIVDQPFAQNDVSKEMQRELPFGIVGGRNGVNEDIAAKINNHETCAVNKRRAHYGIPAHTYATGLAISGGGIRSATFALGVLTSLAKRNLLPQFDYMSTVSGGGYIGSFITTYLESNSSNVGLRSGDDPFRRNGAEGEALGHIRHNSKYLHTSTWERFKLSISQVYGMLINATALTVLPMSVAVFEFIIRLVFEELDSGLKLWQTSLLMLTIAALIPGLSRWNGWVRSHVDNLLAMVAACSVIIVAWAVFGWAHAKLQFFNYTGRSFLYDNFSVLLLSAVVPIVSAIALSLTGRKYQFLQLAFAVIAGLSAPLFFLIIEFIAFEWLVVSYPMAHLSLDAFTNQNFVVLLSVIIGIYLFLWVPLDINFTSPHRHYRQKLSKAFLIQSCEGEVVAFKSVEIKISDAGESGRGPYHILNATLNVPNTRSAKLQGRPTDFFMFSPAYCGSPLTGYYLTKEWERRDSRLDLPTAMAISGAAASPIMGLATIPHLTFWLGILNVRLGYWVRRPDRGSCSRVPGATYLMQEMLGRIDERDAFLHVTDGGHIENLGVYELLRRRCKYIVAIDGEFDPAMTFQSLTTLQRLAMIDMGISIDIDLEDLRLNSSGLSRSHFQICRVRYPDSNGSPGGVGYLIYVKLSLTGNEGEFIRRYRADEPDFPHHSTANQSFSEAQFEAYRSLGEHVGEKLFLEAIVGHLSKSPSIEEWFGGIGQRMLSPIH